MAKVNFFKHSKYQQLSDANLIQNYKQHLDLELLSILYSRYIHLVFGLCLKYFKNEADSEDAVMQIFEQLIKKLQHHEVQNFKSWLHVLSRNYCLMQLRKKSKDPFISADEDVIEKAFEVPFITSDTKESEIQQLESCIETLNEEQKICIKYFYLEQKCYNEIHQITGLALSKVKSCIQNGKRNLKICIEKNTRDD